MDSRQADEEKPETLVTEFEVPEDILYFDGFADSSEEELKALYGTLNLAMTFKDFLHIQNYYKKERAQGSVCDGDPCAGYLLVGSLPPYYLFHRA